MKIGPKYKIARRLKASVFEKTQTQKYSLREERKTRRTRSSRPKTDFGMQLNEKQKARMFYCVAEKQFAKYVKNALSQKGTSPTTHLVNTLERRLDNVVWRAGEMPTHLSARQGVAHGHFTVNGKRVYTPSFSVKPGDKIEIREGSRESVLFNNIDEKILNTQAPAWIAWDSAKKTITIKEGSTVDDKNFLFDIGQVIEYYQR